MTVPEHIKVVAHGEFNESSQTANLTPEEWSMGWKFSGASALGPFDTTAQDVHVENIFGIVGAYLSASSLFPTTVRLDKVTAYKIGTDGNMEGNPNTFLAAAGDELRGNASTKYPFQVALVVTTVAANRGPARFGRFYLPTPAIAMDTTGRANLTDVTQLLADTVQMLKDVSDEVDLADVQSSELLNVSSLQGGKRQTVDHIQIGRVFDTHRSRRTSLDEDYQASSHIDW